jgi:rubredoxin
LLLPEGTLCPQCGIGHFSRSDERESQSTVFYLKRQGKLRKGQENLLTVFKCDNCGHIAGEIGQRVLVLRQTLRGRKMKNQKPRRLRTQHDEFD